LYCGTLYYKTVVVLCTQLTNIGVKVSIGKREEVEELLRMGRAGQTNSGSSGEKQIAKMIDVVIMSGLSVAAVGSLDSKTQSLIQRLLTDEAFRDEVCWRFQWGDLSQMPERKPKSGMTVQVDITQEELDRINSILGKQYVLR